MRLIPWGQKESRHPHTCSFFLPFPLLSLCPSDAHTALSICTPLSTLPLSCPLKPEVTRGQGKYHSVRGTLEEERAPFRENLSLVSFFFFYLFTSVILDIWAQKILCQRVVRQWAMICVQRYFHGSQILDLLCPV